MEIDFFNLKPMNVGASRFIYRKPYLVFVSFTVEEFMCFFFPKGKHNSNTNALDTQISKIYIWENANVCFLTETNRKPNNNFSINMFMCRVYNASCTLSVLSGDPLMFCIIPTVFDILSVFPYENFSQVKRIFYSTETLLLQINTFFYSMNLNFHIFLKCMQNLTDGNMISRISQKHRFLFFFLVK